MRRTVCVLAVVLGAACGINEHRASAASATPGADCTLNDVRCVDGVWEVCTQPRPEDVREWFPAVDCKSAGLECDTAKVCLGLPP